MCPARGLRRLSEPSFSPGQGYRTSLHGGIDPSKRDASGALALPNRIHAARAPIRPSRGPHAALMRPRPRCGPAPPPMRPGAHAATDDPCLDEQIMHCRKQVTAA